MAISDVRKKRFSRRLQIRFWKVGELHANAAYTTNISATGMFISTASPLPSGSRIRVEILNGDRSFLVEGLVVHAAKVSPVLRKLKESGMGVRFLSVEELIRELIPDIGDEELLNPPPQHRVSGSAGGPRSESSAAGPRATGGERQPAEAPEGGARSRRQHADEPQARRIDSRRREPAGEPRSSTALPPDPPARAAAPPDLGIDDDARCALRFSSIEEAREVFQRDIRAGGVFLASAEPVAIDQRLTVEIHLPQPVDRVLRFRGRVVHSAGSGIGVEFTDPDRVLQEMGRLLADES